MRKLLGTFNAKAKCPKCGHGKIRSSYEPHVANDKTGWYERQYGEMRNFPHHEFILRSCECCNYQWPEACK